MAGKPKRSIDFAGWRADIFENDTKIDELIDGQGWIGFSIYFYLCQKAYASDGYFYRWSYANAATTARRMGGGIRSETIKQVVALCLRIGLFDKRLFDRESVLTSRGIQRRYMVAIEKRSFKKVEEKFWLLNEDESEGVIVVPENIDSLPENVDSLPENATNKSKEKHSKVKESKAEESISSPPSPTTLSTKKAWLSQENYDSLVYDYGKNIVDEYLDKIEKWTAKKNISIGECEGVMRKWITQDGIKPIDHSIDKYNSVINQF